MRWRRFFTRHRDRTVENNLTRAQSLEVMRQFLLDYAGYGGSHADISFILDDIRLASSGEILNPVVAQYWQEALRQSTPLSVLTKMQAFDAMRNFLEGYWQRERLDEAGNLLSGISTDVWADGSITDKAFLSDWDDAVEKELRESE